MGEYRSTYPMMSDENLGSSTPHFAWFHPGNYMSAMRNGINPFQGSQHNTEEITVIPNTSIPIHTIPNTLKPEPEPINPTKQPKTSKPKKYKKNPSNSPKPKGVIRRGRKNSTFAANESSMDGNGGSLSPFCSCTGVPRQCYRWGSGGWQSACCTTNISEYPLPMSETRPGSRTAGRKMSHGAFVKLLGRLASEGYDLTSALDLKDHWARHGTNKFVILK